jgi:hypothetical protein
VSGFLWPGDADCYSVRFAAPTVAKVELEAPEGVDVKLEWIAQSPDGTVEVLARADDGGPGKPELLPNPAGDKLLLRVTARARDTAFDAPYQVTVTAIGDDGAGEREPNGVPGRATAIEVGRPLRAFLAPRGDEDWYKLAAPAAGQLRATAQGGPRGLTVTLYDESRAPVGGSSGASAKGPVEAGRSYYVVVRDPAGKASDPRNAYTLSLSVE